MAERRFDIQLLGDKALSAKLAALTGTLERKVLTQAFRKASQTVLSAAQQNVMAGSRTAVQFRGKRKGQALTTPQVRRLRRQGAVVTGIRNSLSIRPLKRKRNRVGYTVVTGARTSMGITDRYYYPAHVEKGHGPPQRRASAVTRALRREFGQRRTPPHPYLRPALKSNEGRLLSQLSHDIGAGIEKVVHDK